MIKIYLQNGKPFIWNAEDVFKLRKEHRIVGKLVGCFPKQAFQNAYKFLPLQLMPEEALLLKEKGICQLLQNTAVEGTPSPEIRTKYWEDRNNCCDEQIVKFKLVRLRTVLEKVEEILAGKRKRNAPGFEHKRVSKRRRKRFLKSKAARKKGAKNDSSPSKSATEETGTEEAVSNGLSNVSPSNGGESAVQVSLDSDCVTSNDIPKLDQNESEIPTASEKEFDEALRRELDKLDSERRAIVEEELGKLPKVGHDNCMVQLFTECMWKNDTAANFQFPESRNEKLRYAVFKDLWEKGYYITPGMKFGGDFLVYAGDPIKFHALFIVLCIDREQDFCSSQLITYGRLGNQVKKSFVLASLMPNGIVEYISLKWAAHLVSDKYSDSH